MHFAVLAVLCSKISASDISFSAERRAPDDHKRERTAWKLAVTPLFSLFFTTQNSEKRLLERTG
jgi:hypothetical protein